MAKQVVRPFIEIFQILAKANMPWCKYRRQLYNLADAERKTLLLKDIF